MARGIYTVFLLVMVLFVDAQTFATRTGFIGFYSKTPLEDISAENKQVYAVIDAAKQQLAFSLLMKGFVFKKQLMQDHFNENYVESDKYPKATFTGKFTGDVNWNKDGSYPVKVSGDLTLHGVTRSIQVPAILQLENGKLIGKSGFKVKPADFNIKIPALVKDKIAQEISVQVTIDCNPIK